MPNVLPMQGDYLCHNLLEGTCVKYRSVIQNCDRTGKGWFDSITGEPLSPCELEAVACSGSPPTGLAYCDDCCQRGTAPSYTKSIAVPFYWTDSSPDVLLKIEHSFALAWCAYDICVNNPPISSPTDPCVDGVDKLFVTIEPYVVMNGETYYFALDAHGDPIPSYTVEAFCPSAAPGGVNLYFSPQDFDLTPNGCQHVLYATITWGSTGPLWYGGVNTVFKNLGIDCPTRDTTGEYCDS